MQARELEERIAAFPGWRYEFQFEGGVSTPVADPAIANRQLQRRRYFFEPLLKLTGGSLQGRRVLDLGCNAGYWALQALEAGADFVLGVDAQESYLQQARLVFEAKGIEPSRYRFEHADVFEYEFGIGFDVVLCLGLLDHVARPLALFELMAGVGAELIVLESEVSRARTSLFELTRLYDTRDAAGGPVVLIPSPRALADLAGQYGFAAVALAPEFTDDTGMSDYRRHRRLAFICSARLPLDGLPAAASGGIVPWWVRDPRALLNA